MARTFAQTLADDMANAFLDGNVFGQSWTHTKPDGTTETVSGALDEDAPQPVQSGPDGEAIMRQGILLLPASVVVSVEKGKASKFTRDARTWIAVGISSDDQAHEVRVASNTATHLRGGHRSGVQS
jgi:hypothetical protein